MDFLFDTYSEALPRVEAWAAERFPRAEDEPEAAHPARSGPRRSTCCAGCCPRSSLSHMGIFATGQAYEQLLLRLLASPLPEARDYGADDPRGAEDGGAELRGARRAPRPRRRVDRLPRGARAGRRSAGRRGWGSTGRGATRRRARPCGCSRSRAARTTCSPRCCSRRPPCPRTRRRAALATCRPTSAPRCWPSWWASAPTAATAPGAASRRSATASRSSPTTARSATSSATAC